MELTLKNLVGRVIDPKRLELGWSCSEADGGGCEIYGVVSAGRRLGSEELLESGCFDFGGGSGMPVMVTARILTNQDHIILDIDTDAYASYGAAHGRPVECKVNSRDEQLLAAEISRFLIEPVFVGGRIVEDQTWLRELMPQFQKLSQGIEHLEQLAAEYSHRNIGLQQAVATGWEVEPDQGTCFGYLNLITDLDQSFWIGMLLTFNQSVMLGSIKFVLTEDQPPTKQDAVGGYDHDIADGFNCVRLRKCLDAITVRQVQ